MNARRFWSVGPLVPNAWLAAALLAGAAACTHTPEPPALAVSVLSGQTPPPVVLVGQPLQGADPLKPWLTSFVLLGGQEELADVLGAFAAGLRRADLTASPAARRIAVEAVHAAIRAPDFAQRFDAVRLVVDNLHAAAPASPEARFARAYLRLVLLADGQGGLTAAGMERSLVADLHTDLSALVEQNPDFVGPGEFSPAWLRKRRDDVAALLVGMPEATTPTAAALPAAATAAAPAVPRPAAAP